MGGGVTASRLFFGRLSVERSVRFWVQPCQGLTFMAGPATAANPFALRYGVRLLRRPFPAPRIGSFAPSESSVQKITPLRWVPTFCNLDS